MLIDKIAICNMALANLGQRPIQSLNQPGASAESCRLRYDEARLEALAAAPWNFSTTWTTGLALAIDPKPNYTYAFAYPANALRVFYIVHDDDVDAPDFEVNERPDGLGRVISTNEPAPVFVYGRDREDVTTFDQEFIQALSWLLSSKIAMPITKNQKIQQKAENTWLGLKSVAEAATKNEGSKKDDRLGFYHEARN